MCWATSRSTTSISSSRSSRRRGWPIAGNTDAGERRCSAPSPGPGGSWSCWSFPDEAAFEAFRTDPTAPRRARNGSGPRRPRMVATSSSSSSSQAVAPRRSVTGRVFPPVRSSTRFRVGTGSGTGTAVAGPTGPRQSQDPRCRDPAPDARGHLDDRPAELAPVGAVAGVPVGAMAGLPTDDHVTGHQRVAGGAVLRPLLAQRPRHHVSNIRSMMWKVYLRLGRTGELRAVPAGSDGLPDQPGDDAQHDRVRLCRLDPVGGQPLP